MDATKNADVVIFVLGEHSHMSGVAKNHSCLKFHGVQQKLAQQIMAAGKPVVVLLMNGRPLSVTWLVENVPAIWNAGF